MSFNKYVRNDPSNQDFQVNRRALVESEVLDDELKQIFEKCWIYAGHESEIKAIGDFKTRNVCGRPVILCRDANEKVRVYLNVCRHRASGEFKRVLLFLPWLELQHKWRVRWGTWQGKLSTKF